MSVLPALDALCRSLRVQFASSTINKTLGRPIAQE